MRLNDLVKLYGGDARLALRNSDGVTAIPLVYTTADEGVYNQDEDVYDLLSQSSLHELEQKHQSGCLDFFSLVVVDV